MANQNTSANESLKGSEYQQKKLKQALLMKRLMNFIPIIGTIVLAIIRNFTGSRSRFLLPMCAVCGAGFVTVCDLAARLLFVPYELPVGILTAVIGGPIFIWMLKKNNKEKK